MDLVLNRIKNQSVIDRSDILTQLLRASPTDYPRQLQLIDVQGAKLSGGISLLHRHKTRIFLCGRRVKKVARVRMSSLVC